MIKYVILKFKREFEEKKQKYFLKLEITLFLTLSEKLKFVQGGSFLIQTILLNLSSLATTVH